MPSLTVRPCLSQDFVAGGSSLRWVKNTKRGMNFTSFLTDFVCHGVLEYVKKQQCLVLSPVLAGITRSYMLGGSHTYT